MHAVGLLDNRMAAERERGKEESELLGNVMLSNSNYQ